MLKRLYGAAASFSRSNQKSTGSSQSSGEFDEPAAGRSSQGLDTGFGAQAELSSAHSDNITGGAEPQGNRTSLSQQTRLKLGAKQISGDSAYDNIGRPSFGTGSSGSRPPISDDSAYTTNAGKSLLDAGPRLQGPRPLVDNTGSLGKAHSLKSAPAPSKSPLGPSAVGLGGYKPSRSSIEHRPSGERKRGSFDSAHVGGSRLSLQMDSNRGSTEPRTGDSLPSSSAATYGSLDQDRCPRRGSRLSGLARVELGSGSQGTAAAAPAQHSAELSILRDPVTEAACEEMLARFSFAEGEEQPAPSKQGARAQTHKSAPSDRRSGDSGKDQSETGRSHRSSFALERASLESNRASLDMFRQGSSPQTTEQQPAVNYEDLELMCDQLGIPRAMRDRYLRLSVIPDNTPLPMSMLSKLWRVSNEHDAEATANLMEQRGIMRVACLYDGSAWALVEAAHLKHLRGVAWSSVPDVHADLLDDYMEGRETLSDVPDDGYIMQNVGHHLVGAKRLRDLKKLLSKPDWLETKLHSYGVASVVADFRRFLMVTNDEEIKLLLEALQMSVSSCMQHPDVAMLRAQMVGRLMAIKNTQLQEWVVGERHAVGAACEGRMQCLLPKTPTLEQAGGLHRMVLRGHSSAIISTLLTPGGIDVITASTDGTARVWDMEIGDCVLLLEGHTGPVTDLALSGDGSILVTASADRSARVWSLDQGQCLAVLEGHEGVINHVEMDAYGRFAVTVSADGTGRVWDLSSGQCAHILRGHGSATDSGAIWAVALTPDHRQAITASEDFTARVWDMVSGSCTRVLEGHTGWVVDVAVMADGKHAITASHDATARVWHLGSSLCTHVLKGHAGRLNAVKVAATNHTAITVSDDYTARVWDWSTGQCRHILEGHGGWLSDVAIVNSGARAVTVSGDGLAVVWDLEAGVCSNVLEGHSEEVRSVVLTRRGRFAVTASEDTTARVWDLAASSASMQQMHTGKVHSITTSPDGLTAVSVGEDAIATVWDTVTGQCKHVLKGHAAALRWSSVVANGQRLLTVSGDRMVKAWDLQSGKCTQTLPSHKGSRVKSFSASPDGSTAVIVLFDSTVAVWDLVTMQCKCMLQKWGDRDSTRVHSGGVNAAYLTPDGSTAVTVSKDHTARVWDIASGECTHVMQGHTDGIVMGNLNDDGQIFLSISFDQSARVWDMETGGCLAVLQHQQQLSQGIIAPDACHAVTVTVDRVAHLWDLSTGKRTHTLSGHKEDIAHVAFSPDSDHIATCSYDCTAQVWNVETGAAEGFFMADCGLTYCAFVNISGHLDTLMVGGQNGVIHFLQL